MVPGLATAQEVTNQMVLFLPSASDSLRQGLVRIVNESGRSGTVRMVAVDDSGRRFEELALEIAAGEVVHFSSADLEMGNPDIGLSAGTGPGQGDWRLEFTGDLKIEPRAYADKDGFLTAMHDTAPLRAGHYRVAIFNPGSNDNQVGLLRLVNAGETASAITIRGIDDAGVSPGDAVTVDVPAGEARTFTAAELESGAAGLIGALGDGEGKWRLDVEATEPVQVMSLLASPAGHLTNLSTIPTHEANGVHRVPLFPPASDPFGRQGFVRVVNISEAAGEVRIQAFDDTDWTYEPVTLTLDAGETGHFNSDDLELGNVEKRLVGSTGPGEGAWRLALTSELDIEVMSYIRTHPGGYVTAMHDTAPEQMDGGMRYYVPIFHPERHEAQESRLQLINLGDSDAGVVIEGRDDRGERAPGDEVRLHLPAGSARTLTAGQLERGGEGLSGEGLSRGEGLSGGLGTGEGKWRLTVDADQALQVMSLGHSPVGPLANLSRGRPPQGEGGPDILIESFVTSDDSVDTDEEFTLTVVVRNRGAVETSETTVRVYRHIGASYEAVWSAESELESRPLGTLGAFERQEFSLATVQTVPARYVWYRACVDAVAGEPFLANNCSSLVHVRAFPPGDGSTLWGATSHDVFECAENAYASGIAVDKESQQAAVDAARKECTSEGGTAFQCLSVASTHRQCFAMYFGYVRFERRTNCAMGPAEGASKAAAEQSALATCRLNDPPHNCTIAGSACNSSPE